MARSTSSSGIDAVGTRRLFDRETISEAFHSFCARFAAGSSAGP